MTPSSNHDRLKEYFACRRCFVCSEAAAALKVPELPSGRPDYEARKAALLARSLTWCEHREVGVALADLDWLDRAAAPVAAPAAAKKPVERETRSEPARRPVRHAKGR